MLAATIATSKFIADVKAMATVSMQVSVSSQIICIQ